MAQIRKPNYAPWDEGNEGLEFITVPAGPDVATVQADGDF